MSHALTGNGTTWHISSIAVLLLGCAGCGSGLYPVTGVVQYDDKQPASELAGGFVNFQPTEHESSATGVIQADGGFVLSTNAEADGVLPGNYKVLVTPPPFVGGGGARPKMLVDPTYGKPESTDLTAVVEAKENRLTVTIRRPKTERSVAAPN